MEFILTWLDVWKKLFKKLNLCNYTFSCLFLYNHLKNLIYFFLIRVHFVLLIWIKKFFNGFFHPLNFLLYHSHINSSHCVFYRGQDRVAFPLTETKRYHNNVEYEEFFILYFNQSCNFLVCYVVWRWTLSICYNGLLQESF